MLVGVKDQKIVKDCMAMGSILRLMTETQKAKDFILKVVDFGDCDREVLKDYIEKDMGASLKASKDVGSTKCYYLVSFKTPKSRLEINRKGLDTLHSCKYDGALMSCPLESKYRKASNYLRSWI